MANIDTIGSWNSTDFENYFSNSHRFGGSSDMFKQIREQLKELKELDSMPVTKELAEGRRLLLEMIQETSSKYISERSGAFSSQGKERLEVAQALERFCASEIPLMKAEKKLEYFEEKCRLRQKYSICLRQEVAMLGYLADKALICGLIWSVS